MEELLTKYNEINSIDLNNLSNLVKNDEHRGYFLGNAGDEHYRLLAYISTLFDNVSLIDIGTYKGNSSIALSYNQTNTVHSFDLVDSKDLHSFPVNINYYLDDVLKNEYKQLILHSPFILLDTDHDGTFEHKFHNYLIDIQYKGYLMLDDIKLNNEMQHYWNSITEEKYDISQMGHWSGTGLVIFK
jgi:hypothetical protein